ncbi:DUF5808 domain-containing protein [Proteiniphilum sp. UBA1028]|jgi:uncharacterized membrane protein|uniref:DUF5808 domain-containing protein n=1 Tax=Proteiniphilum sp. UBA1028 TaxID=1947251 RepID=UPI000E7E1A61|nr:DUF5808 domain-containing protein [Proteiniphilum sp. UBA1028]HBG58009.1 hypothetical protein [Porphyromonadaceae bacterium]
MRNDRENYKWGIFYYNPNDPRIILPKRNRFMGWTVNFANPFAYLIIIGIILFGIIMAYLD